MLKLIGFIIFTVNVPKHLKTKRSGSRSNNHAYGNNEIIKNQE